MVDILITRLDRGVPVPAYEHPGDAGADLVTTVDATLQPGERALLPTGIALAIPDGFAAFVHPRSGLAVRHGVSLVNAPGTVDAGYRGAYVSGGYLQSCYGRLSLDLGLGFGATGGLPLRAYAEGFARLSDLAAGERLGWRLGIGLGGDGSIRTGAARR